LVHPDDRADELHPHANTVVSRPELVDQILLAGDMPCPAVAGVLGPFGNGRTCIVGAKYAPPGLSRDPEQSVLMRAQLGAGRSGIAVLFGA